MIQRIQLQLRLTAYIAARWSSIDQTQHSTTVRLSARPRTTLAFRWFPANTTSLTRVSHHQTKSFNNKDRHWNHYSLSLRPTKLSISLSVAQSKCNSSEHSVQQWKTQQRSELRVSYWCRWWMSDSWADLLTRSIFLSFFIIIIHHRLNGKTAVSQTIFVHPTTFYVAEVYDKSGTLVQNLTLSPPMPRIFPSKPLI